MSPPNSHLPRLYQELVDWWPVLSAPEDYAEEAAFYRQVLLEACASPPRTLLELGSGGGNNASHLKHDFQMTLVDLSPGMLEVSQQLNPECEHLLGDMRSLHLGRQFDAVFIHDAISYITSEADLARTIQTAYAHCRPGGAALFCPDATRESFQPSTGHGGHDAGERSLRYLEWTYDPDPQDTTYITEMVYLLRLGTDPVQCVHDCHIDGLFSHTTWLALITSAGFSAHAVPFIHSEVDPQVSPPVFVGMKRSETGLTRSQ